MVVGLVLTVVAAVVPIVDQLTVHGIATHLNAVYAGTGVPPPAASGPIVYLVVLEVFGILAWLVTIQAVRRGRRWARPVATGLLAVATVLAVMDLTASEYGTEPILPLWLGVVGLLPCLAGFVAIALMWRPTRGPRAARPWPATPKRSTR
jgi:hypothetical protein